MNYFQNSYRHYSRAAACGLALIVSSLISDDTHAQSRQIPAPAQPAPVFIHGGTVHSVDGETFDKGYILFTDGKITSIGTGNPQRLPNNVRKIDAKGLHIYPGLIAAKTELGLTETGAVDVTNDQTELGRLKPEVRAAVAINPDTDLIPVTRANGILLGCIFPSGGLVSGRCSTIRFDGWTWENMAIDPDAGLVISWPRTEPVNAWWMEESEADQRKNISTDLENVERFFDEAEAYVKARENNKSLDSDLRFEAMRDAIAGKKPMFVNAASSGQIESAVAWGARRGYKIVIVGGDEADQVTGVLKEHDVPVIIDGLHRTPGRRHYSPSQPFELPAKLYKAGVRFCIASGQEAAHERNLNHIAATAAAYGLPKDEAIKAVTISAANILGFGDTYGSLKTGKSATLIITTGDPLEITTDTLIAFIDGRELDLGSRHKALYEKYREKYKQMGLLKSE